MALDNVTTERPALSARDDELLIRSRFRQMLCRAARDRALVISGGLVLLFLVLGVLAPVVAPYPYEEQDLTNTFAPPLSSGHLLGTDHLGRDVLSRLVFGIRTSLYVAGIATVASLVIGMAIGLAAGYYGGRLDRALSALMDLAWSFPILLVAILTVAILGPGITPILVGITVVNWAGFSRIIRGETLSLREKEFVEAARAVGVSNSRILVQHIMPNTLAPTFVMASFYMGIIISVEASLSFIGLGAQPPLPSLGQMVDDGKSYLFHDIWLIIVPGTFLGVLVLAFNQLGDALRDLIDPSLQA